MWLGLLYVRGPNPRRMIEALGDLTIKPELYYQFLFSNTKQDTPADTAIDLADVRKWLDDVDFIRHQNDYIRVMADLWPRIARVLQVRRWTLIKYLEPGILLPDNPIVLTETDSD